MRDRTERRPEESKRYPQFEQRARRIVLCDDQRQYLAEDDNRQNHSTECEAEEMFRIEFMGDRTEQDRDRGDREMNAECQREAQLVMMIQDRSPEPGVSRVFLLTR